MNTKESSRRQWSRLTPETRSSLRNLYRCMREVSCLDRFTATAYVSWAASTANLEATLKRCSHD